MANGLDRLERLFAYKRRASPPPSQRSNSLPQPFEQQFPSPSFIRPKTGRMTARQEVRLRQAAGRSPSVPDILTSADAAQCHTYLGSGSSDSNCQLQRKLVRSPSFGHRRTDQLNSRLREFQFPKPLDNGIRAPPSPLALDTSAMLGDSRLSTSDCGSRSPRDISTLSPRGLVTPPSSDSEDGGPYVPSSSGKTPQMSITARLPTPGQSPDMRPLSDALLRNAKSAESLDKALYKAIEVQLGEPFDHHMLGRSYSQSSIAASAPSFCSSTLREPDVNEFLSLSDDDIAESNPSSPVLDALEDEGSSLPLMDLSISSSEPLPSPLLTLTPPRASRPAAVAAFEAARIARRYDFDLVYVVNLWPGVSARAETDKMRGIKKPMVGRLLAAHGLHHVSSPLQISSDVHTTILRSDGWVEYQNQDSSPQDLARGYACAFYTGQYAPNTSSRSTSPVSGVRLSEKIDRGIVFAAYRKPRDGSDKLGKTFRDEELGELHRDAEVLVEMVLDIHVASRNRQSPTGISLTDDTGPIPSGQIDIA